MDSLEYTREGLKTRESFSLATGGHHRLVIVRPRRVEVIGDGRGGFGHDSCFPLPSTLSVFWHFAHRLSVFNHLQDPPELGTGGFFQVYAHASTSGDEAFNKELTDRRAAVALSLLRGDVDAFTERADSEGWELEHHQAILRMLGCDPGPVDGKLGDLTRSATELFQHRYRAGDFHRHRDVIPRHSDAFEKAGELDQATTLALLEAFVAAHGAHVQDGAVHPTHPSAGCSEFNPLADEPSSAQRRVSLVRHEALTEHHDAAPCIEGDAGACAVVGDYVQRCMWFREHVIDRTAPTPVRFYDPRWLPLPSGRFLLSALTTLDEHSTAVFEVLGGTEDDRNALGESVSEKIKARPRLGVVAAVWEPDTSLRSAPGEAPRTPGRPVFRVADSEGQGEVRAAWPKKETVRVLVGEGDVAQVRALDVLFRLRSTDGLYQATASLAESVMLSPVHSALEFHEVPVESRFILEADLHGEPDFDTTYFEDVTLEGAAGMCSEGEICTDPPEPPKPPGARDHAD